MRETARSFKPRSGRPQLSATDGLPAQRKVRVGWNHRLMTGVHRVPCSDCSPAAYAISDQTCKLAAFGHQTREKNRRPCVRQNWPQHARISLSASLCRTWAAVSCHLSHASAIQATPTSVSAGLAGKGMLGACAFEDAEPWPSQVFVPLTGGWHLYCSSEWQTSALSATASASPLQSSVRKPPGPSSGRS